MAETQLEKAERHIASLERVIAAQRGIIGRLKRLGDDAGATMAADILRTLEHSLVLALEHRNHLRRR